MIDEMKITYVQLQIVCASIRAAGISAANTAALLKKEYPPYTESDFENLIEEYSIHHNAVISYLMDK